MNKKRTLYAQALDPEPTLPPSGIRGRGAVSNASGRFEPHAHVLVDDGWGSLETPAAQRRTTVTVEAAKSIIARNASPDLSFDRSVNPYRGCEHGCVYCFARPTHAFQGLSPGLDFETQLFAKPNAAALLERELRAPSYTPRVLAMGTNTDPYQPIERDWAITRQVVEVLWAYRHPLAIVTKGALVTRDIDILGPMAERGLAKVAFSITTLDRTLARAMEPRAASPERRLEAIAALTEAGIPTSVMVAPVIPGLNDHEIEAILKRAAMAGAHGANYVMLRLPLEIKDLFREWLDTHVPDRALRVMSLVRQMRGGKEYDADWMTRQTGTGPIAAMIARRIKLASRRLGLDRPPVVLDCSQFRPPPRAGDQLALL
ncbi:MAG: PA0069 family radical SAM protein [Pseudomonadota bacterium]